MDRESVPIWSRRQAEEFVDNWNDTFFDNAFDDSVWLSCNQGGHGVSSLLFMCSLDPIFCSNFWWLVL